ncbi:MAG TPA: MFS transporter [Actinomycetota bacterium]|nr:MFS transporter [Actinomycetota bacterium]
MNDPAIVPAQSVAGAPGRDRLHRTAAFAGAAAALVLAGAILLGSRNLGNFDVALLGYALATIFLAYGVTYKTVVWAGSPAARRYLARGWKAMIHPGPDLPKSEVPRTVVSTLLLQRFLARRSVPCWLAHQGLFWGVVSATAITFPLTFGWIHFRAVAGSESGYWIYLLGVRTVQIDALGLAGFVAFHGLNLSAVLVIAGGAWFLRRRWRQRGNNLSQFGRDILPLVALIAISVTGLALTVSSALLGGLAYRPLAFVHMCTVVLTLVWIPFGKFFHTVQRPAMAGVHLHKQSSLAASGAHRCRVCGAEMEGAVFIADLQKTMRELGLDYSGWIETCPACKRLVRGAQYRESIKAGF